MVRGVEVCGGRGESVWEGWSVVGGVRCVVRGVEVSVGGVEVCGREWMCGGGVEECDGRGKVCGGRGGVVWEGWRPVVGGGEECGGRDGGEIRRGGVSVGEVSSARQSR